MKKLGNLIVKGIFSLLFAALLLPVLPFKGAAEDLSPVFITKAIVNNNLNNAKQIIRTSTGRIYYFNGNAGHTGDWDGWIEVVQ